MSKSFRTKKHVGGALLGLEIYARSMFIVMHFWSADQIKHRTMDSPRTISDNMTKFSLLTYRVIVHDRLFWIPGAGLTWTPQTGWVDMMFDVD